MRALLARYRPAWGGVRAGAVLEWRSPRPMSAAGLVVAGGERLFVKRHHSKVRSPGRLAGEHRLAGHLRRRGVPAPVVLATAAGSTVVADGDHLYEVHRAVAGLDLYRDVPSWAPFLALGHALSAGRALADFHHAACTFTAPAEPPGVLTNSTAVVASEDPEAALGRLVDSRPGLARALAGRPLEEDFSRHHLGPALRARAALARVPSQWAHGDWHGSNLAWHSPAADAAVVGVFDLGLANRTAAVHDLALAIERSAVDWLDLAGRGRPEPDLDVVDALLTGYEERRPLCAVESGLLPELLPVVHLEYALSELEYFAEVVGSPKNADLAYEGYLVGHSAWFETGEGALLLEHLRRRAAGAS